MEAIFKGYQDYSEFVHEMEADGWHREQIAVDNTNGALAFTFGLATPGNTAAVINIVCPPGRIMSVMGTQQVPAGADRGTAHSFWMRLASVGTEIHELTHINIQKVTPSTAVVPLIKDIYQNMSLVISRQTVAGGGALGSSGTANVYKGDNEIHRFRKGIILYGQETLQIQVVSTPAMITNVVTAANTQFSLDTDLWTQTV